MAVFFTTVLLVTIFVFLLAWSPVTALIAVLIVTAIVSGYYGRSDGRMPERWR